MPRWRTHRDGAAQQRAVWPYHGYFYVEHRSGTAQSPHCRSNASSGPALRHFISTKKVHKKLVHVATYIITRLIVQTPSFTESVGKIICHRLIKSFWDLLYRLLYFFWYVKFSWTNTLLTYSTLSSTKAVWQRGTSSRFGILFGSKLLLAFPVP